MACTLFNLSLTAIWLLSSGIFWHTRHPLVALALLVPPMVRAGRGLLAGRKTKKEAPWLHGSHFARQQATPSASHDIGSPIAEHAFNEKVSVAVEPEDHQLRHILRDAKRAPGHKQSA